MARQVRVLTAVCVAAVVSVAVSGSASAAPGRATQGSATATWKVGDCYEDADLDNASVDLSSKVACTKAHAVQILGGADLPSALATGDRDELLSSTGRARTQLNDFADKTCAPAAVVGNVYPKKQAKALARLFRENDIEQWVVPAAGGAQILVPDSASFAAGAEAVLCAFVPEDLAAGSTAGDIRGIATGAPLEALRLCYDRNPGSGTERVSCAEDHDLQSLIRLVLDVRGLPGDVDDWSDATWGQFDGLCRKFGEALVGATRKDLSFRSNTDGNQAPVDDTRVMWCETYPVDLTAAMPGGVSVVGLGKAKLTFAEDSNPAR